MTGNIYNISGQSEMSNLDLIKMILKELGKPESLIQFVKDRAGHDQKYCIDSQKIRKELGWQPEINFEYGIKKTLNYYSQSCSEKEVNEKKLLYMI